MATGYQTVINAFHEYRMTSEGRLSYGAYSLQTLALLSYILGGMLLAVIVGLLLGYAVSPVTGAVIGGIAFLVILVVWLVGFFMLGARRCHDAGLGGAYQLAYLIPQIGPLLYMGLMVLDSKPANCGYQENEYSGQTKFEFTKLMEAFRNLIPKSKGRLTYEQFARAQVAVSVAVGILFIVLAVIALSSSAALIGVLASAEDHISDTQSMAAATPMLIAVAVFFLAMFVVECSLMIRRLHDTGRSGSNLWWILIPIIGVCVPLVQCYADSDVDNQYGPAIDDFANTVPGNAVNAPAVDEDSNYWNK